MSPYFQRPIEFGADIVMHSTTKFLNGHSDGLGGVLVGTRPEHKERFAFVQKCTGGILSPFESYLVLRGVKTLALRMRQHDANGRAVAAYLDGHPKISKVFYPGLPSHPQYQLATRQMSGFGSLITFETGSFESANTILRASAYLYGWRIARRCGDIDIAPSKHDSRGDWTGRTRRNRHHRWHVAHLRRSRRC